MGRRSLFQFVVFDVYFPWSPRVAHEGFILANLGEPLFQTLIPLGVSGFNVQQRPRKRERETVDNFPKMKKMKLSLNGLVFYSLLDDEHHFHIGSVRLRPRNEC